MRHIIEQILQDTRFGLRMLWRSPGFTTVAVIMVALGIGANTAIFSIVNIVLVRSLPYPNPDSLVKIVFGNPGVGLHDVTFSYPEFDDIRSRSSVFEQVSVVFPASANLTGGKEPQRLEILGVSPNYFSMLGTIPQMGRLFSSQDVAPGFAQAAVISDGLWRRSFGGDPNIIGKNLRIDNDPYTIVGVLPPGFRHPGRTIAGEVEVWVTAGFRADPFPTERNQRILPGAIGRIKSGLSLQQAQAKLDAFADEVRKDYPDNYPSQAKWSIEIVPLQESLVGNVRPMLLALMGAVILIILIASVNIANLLLARASGRQQEIAVRLALGCSRARMVRQMLTESVVLALIAGLAGVLTASVVLDFILPFVPSKIPRLNEVGVDWVVLGFAMLISIFTGLLFGLAPAIQAVKVDLSAAIREGSSRSGYSAKTGRLRDLLIVSELALAVVLMVGAGLLLRTFWRLLQEDPGFNPSKVVTAGIWLPVPNDPKADPYAGITPQTNFVHEALKRIEAIPGIELAAMTSTLPAAAERTASAALTVEDRPVESSTDLSAEVIRVSPDFFKVMQSPLVRGRFFSDGDEAGKEQVAIIDETTARRYWPDRDPVGRRLRLGQNAAAPWLTVVGIIKDIKHDGLDMDGVPHIYICIYQRPSRTMNVVMRTPLAASALESQIRREIQAVDPNLPVFNVCAMNDVINASLAPRRFSAEMVGIFAVLALLLASIGIYGLLAYMVGQSSHEIGIRMALGAQTADILKLILRKAVLLAGTGILVGLLFAAAAAPLITTLLYGVNPIDPTVFLAVPLLLLTAALSAGYIPARRATKVNPITVLRQ